MMPVYERDCPELGAIFRTTFATAP